MDIFFVVSGFVIALVSLNSPLRWNDLPNFMLRRLARLAPPYWLSILLMLAVLCLQVVLTSSRHSAAVWPFLASNASLVGIHILYLQDLLGLNNFSVVYWTLCIEVQFYLVFAVGLIVYRQITSDRAAHFSLGATLLGLSWLASILLWLNDWHAISKTFLIYWHEFAVGILACRLVGSPRSRRWEKIMAFVILSGGAWLAVLHDRTGLLVAVATSAIIWYFGARNRLQTAWDNSVLQFMGTISYSLYLVHVPIGTLFMGLKTRLASHENVFVDFALFFLAVACSLGCAVVFYRVVERPAMVLSRRFRLAA